VFDIIFSSFWNWLGAVGLILACGWAVSLPIYWFAYLKKIMHLQKIQPKTTSQPIRNPLDAYYK
jgi:hypothetical protein